jgi:pyridoxal phosphate enzyme (YggS family)
MPVNKEIYFKIFEELNNQNIKLVAVSKMQTVQDIQTLYDLGQRDFGENYVQELVEKQALLPKDIRWHFIGHLQSNKVKYIAPFVHLIHTVDSLKLLSQINSQAEKNTKIIDVLLQVHIAQEETKFGLDENELQVIFINKVGEIEKHKNIRINGLMGMASFSDKKEQILSEFQTLNNIFKKYKNQSVSNCDFEILSTGMSGDYKIAIEAGSTLVRIGSLIFGARSSSSAPK